MELQKLQKQLKNQLEKEIKGTIIHTDIWCIPMYTYEISYQPLRKKTMDILMKILLFSFQQSAFESADELSGILMVEPLFIEDIIRKMQKNGLLERENNRYHISEKGKTQSSRGVFEEELDPASMELLYSPVHHQFFEGDIEEVLDFDDFPDRTYRHFQEKDAPILSEEYVGKEIQHRQTDESLQIKSILSVENTQVNDVPCIEMVVWKSENKELIFRVWNTLFNNWDRQIEKELYEKEGAEWLIKLQNELN